MMDLGRCGNHEEAIKNLKVGQKESREAIEDIKKELGELKEVSARNEIRYEKIELSLAKIETKIENRMGNRILEKIIEYVVIFFIAYLLSGRFNANERIGNSEKSINKTRRIETESLSMHSRESNSWSWKKYRTEGNIKRGSDVSSS